jgi:protease-4
MDHYLSTNTETLTVGSPLVEMFTSERGFNQAERAAFAGFIDRAYQQFIGLVADGRGMTTEQVREVAQGRVWTGQQALDRGLVDHLGGFSVAVARARALAGIEEDARVQLRTYPAVESPFKAFEQMFGVSASSVQALVRLNAALSDPRMQRVLAAMGEDDVNVRAETDRFTVE